METAGVSSHSGSTYTTPPLLRRYNPNRVRAIITDRNAIDLNSLIFDPPDITVLEDPNPGSVAFSGVDSSFEFGQDALFVEGNYPNPFNPKTAIRFSLDEADRVSVRIYDMTGRLVAAPRIVTLNQALITFSLMVRGWPVGCTITQSVLRGVTKHKHARCSWQNKYIRDCPMRTYLILILTGCSVVISNAYGQKGNITGSVTVGGRTGMD